MHPARNGLAHLFGPNGNYWVSKIFGIDDLIGFYQSKMIFLEIGFPDGRSLGIVHRCRLHSLLHSHLVLFKVQVGSNIIINRIFPIAFL